mgnify:FL=1
MHMIALEKQFTNSYQKRYKKRSKHMVRFTCQTGGRILWTGMEEGKGAAGEPWRICLSVWIYLSLCVRPQLSWIYWGKDAKERSDACGDRRRIRPDAIGKTRTQSHHFAPDKPYPDRCNLCRCHCGIFSGSNKAGGAAGCIRMQFR